MYKVVETFDKYSQKNIQLHKGYRTKLHVPLAFRLFAAGNVIFIGSGTLLSIMIGAPFLWLLSGILLIAFFTAMITDVYKFEFKPRRKVESDGRVSAGGGVEYRLLAQLQDTMTYEEVDNFSNRQDLASEIYNLIKVHRADKSLVNDGGLIAAEYKLRDIEAEARRQRKEIKLAGLNAETPALDLAAAIVRKKD